MKPNTYVKIVSSGIANPVEELMPFIQGEEIMPLQEDESVEVRSSVLNEGNIIIFRNRKSRDVLSVIHTPYTVYIQEQNKTISTHRPYSSFLFGVDDDGKVEPAAALFKIELPNKFYLEASPELQDVAAYVTSVLEQLNPAIIEMTLEFDRFNLPCRKNVGLEPAFSYLNEALHDAVGYVLLPVKAGSSHRSAIDYFYLEPVMDISSKDSDEDEPKSVRKSERICIDNKQLFKNPGDMVDLTKGGQAGFTPKPEVDDPNTWLINPETMQPLHPDSSESQKMWAQIKPE